LNEETNAHSKADPYVIKLAKNLNALHGSRAESHEKLKTVVSD